MDKLGWNCNIVDRGHETDGLAPQLRGYIQAIPCQNGHPKIVLKKAKRDKSPSSISNKNGKGSGCQIKEKRSLRKQLKPLEKLMTCGDLTSNDQLTERLTNKNCSLVPSRSQNPINVGVQKSGKVIQKNGYKKDISPAYGSSREIIPVCGDRQFRAQNSTIYGLQYPLKSTKQRTQPNYDDFQAQTGTRICVQGKNSQSITNFTQMQCRIMGKAIKKQGLQERSRCQQYNEQMRIYTSLESRHNVSGQRLNARDFKNQGQQPRYQEVRQQKKFQLNSTNSISVNQYHQLKTCQNFPLKDALSPDKFWVKPCESGYSDPQNKYATQKVEKSTTNVQQPEIPVKQPISSYSSLLQNDQTRYISLNKLDSSNDFSHIIKKEGGTNTQADELYFERKEDIQNHNLQQTQISHPSFSTLKELQWLSHKLSKRSESVKSLEESDNTSEIQLRHNELVDENGKLPLNLVNVLDHECH